MNRWTRKLVSATAVGAGAVLLVATAAGAAQNGTSGNGGGAPAANSAHVAHAGLSSGGTFTSAAMVPTSASTADVAGPVNSITGSITGATTVSTLAGTVGGTALGPDGQTALVGTESPTLNGVTAPLSPSPTVTSLNVSQFTAEGGSGYTVFTDGVAITPDGTAGLATADSQGAIALKRTGTTWGVDTSVQAPGLNQAAQPHQPGWIEPPSLAPTATLYDGVTISATTGADGHYVGLLMDATDHTVAVVTGLGTAAAKVSGTVTDATNIVSSGSHGYFGFGDYGNGGMSFSPTRATAAAVVTADGFGVLNLTNPAAPTLGSLTTVPVRPAMGRSRWRWPLTATTWPWRWGTSSTSTPGSSTAGAGSPLTISAPAITLPNMVYSLNYTASGNLTVNYENLTGTTGVLATITNTESTPATPGNALLLSGLAPEASMAPRYCPGRGPEHGLPRGGERRRRVCLSQSPVLRVHGRKPLNKPIVGMAPPLTTRVTGRWPATAASSPLETPLPRLGGFPGAEQADRGHGRHAGRPGLLAGGQRRRRLHLRRRPLLRLDGRHRPEQADRGHGRHAGRPGLLAGGQRRRHLLLRGRRLPRLGRLAGAEQAGRGHGRHARRPGLLAGGQRRRRLRLRRRPLLRLDGRHPAQQAGGRHAASNNGQGYWLVASDGGIFAFGTPASSAPWAASRSTSRSWAWLSPSASDLSLVDTENQGASKEGLTLTRVSDALSIAVRRKFMLVDAPAEGARSADCSGSHESEVNVPQPLGVVVGVAAVATIDVPTGPTAAPVADPHQRRSSCKASRWVTM